MQQAATRRITGVAMAPADELGPHLRLVGQAAGGVAVGFCQGAAEAAQDAAHGARHGRLHDDLCSGQRGNAEGGE